MTGRSWPRQSGKSAVDVAMRWTKAEARRLDNRRRAIVATLQAAGWQIEPDPDGQQWAFPPIRPNDTVGRRVPLPGRLLSERQARNLEVSLRQIGPYPREERR